MQNVNLNLIPGSVLPVVNVSQYDKGRHFTLTVYEGATAYSLTGKGVQIRGTKPDGNGFAYDSTDGAISVSNNVVTVSTLQQMTACGGQVMCELRITSGSDVLGTLNFILDCEPSALSDDTPISDTDIPAIERDFQAALDEAEADALIAEGYAKGTQDGVPATSGEPYYQDNAKYYKEQAEAAASGTGGDALKAEGYAVGTQDGVPVGSGSPYYQNNAKYYEGEAATSASNASTSATNAGTSETNAGNSATAAGNSANAAAASALVSEGWANGEQNGTPVSSGSPYYQDNAKYWKDQAAQYAAGGLVFRGSVAFASIPTTGMTNGDMYNITDDFTTDSRFIEGAGISVKAGADIAWVDSVSKWDILALGGGSDDYSQLINKPQINSVELSGNKTAAALGLATDAAMTGASASDAGAKGLVPAPAAGDQDKVLYGDGTWKTPSGGSDMTGATASTPGTHGLVPAPAAGDNTKFLRGDGTWADGGGASALNDLTDVTITSPTDGQVLTYDANSQKWINAAGGGGSTPKVYGAVWDGSASTSWTRTDDAASFAAPEPYYSGMSGTPSSPFDSIQPWAGMVRSTDASAGEVVAIPKFYYKLGYASGSTGLKIQIAPASNGDTWATANGFSVSPAHRDRGDGSGERDVIYVGRYHSASDYKSKTGVSPQVSTRFDICRSGISALGSTVWQWDFSVLTTIKFLYLVEFADWDCQSKIGYGCAPTGYTSSVRSVGYTDSMPYHTGTDQTSRSTYGGTQYRYLEGLWDNCVDFVDGILVNSSHQVCVFNNPSTFSNTYNSSYYAYTITLNSDYGAEYITAYDISTVSGYEWFIWPKTGGGSDSTYTCDGYGYNPLSSINPKSTRVGGLYAQGQSYGLFCQMSRSGMGDVLNNTGCRLMILP